MQRIVAQRNGKEIRHALTDCELKVFRPGAPPEERSIEPEMMPALLAEVFGLELPPEAMDTIVNRAQGARGADVEAGSLGA